MKKENIGILLAILALVGVISVWGLWICNVIGFSVVSLDSFVGVMVAILGLLITFAIGWQIINAFDIRNKLTKIQTLKAEIDEQRNKIDNLVLQVEYQSCINQSYIFDKQGYQHRGFACTMQAINLGLQLNLNEDINIALKNLKEFAIGSKNEECYEDAMKLITSADKGIRAASQFALIKEQYEEIIRLFPAQIE